MYITVLLLCYILCVVALLFEQLDLELNAPSPN